MTNTANSLLAGLNDKQLEAVTLPQQSALILAGAGSGKTRVLTTRIAWLIQTNQVSPTGLLAVTFTNKAAKEMMTRLGAMLPVNVRGMWIGTFHGLCNRFLRAHWKLAGLPQGFQILDSGDTVSAVKRVIKAMKLDEERFVPKQVSWYIAGARRGTWRTIPNLFTERVRNAGTIELAADGAGTRRVVCGEVRVSPFTFKGVSPYVLAGGGRGTARPNVHELFPDPVAHDAALMFTGGGVRVPVAGHLSAFADMRFVLQLDRSEAGVFLFLPVRGGLAWTF